MIVSGETAAKMVRLGNATFESYLQADLSELGRWRKADDGAQVRMAVLTNHSAWRTDHARADDYEAAIAG